MLAQYNGGLTICTLFFIFSSTRHQPFRVDLGLVGQGQRKQVVNPAGLGQVMANALPGHAQHVSQGLLSPAPVFH